MRILVTGSAGSTEEIGEALRGLGAQVVLAADEAQLREVAATAQAGSFDGYVQLPIALTPTEDTIVGRLRGFLDAGLLTRFRLAEAALPLLGDGATVVLVTGHTAIGWDVPDDRAARLRFLEVLAHAIRASRAPAVVRVRVVDRHTPAGEVADIATGQVPAPRRPQPAAHTVERSYADWRTEMLGLATAEF